MNLLEVHARELAGAPEDWYAYTYEAIPHTKPTQYEITGDRAGIMSDGKKVWPHPATSAKRKVKFTIADHELWVDRWEARTGKCKTCVAEGRVFRSWNKQTGCVTVPCSRCHGTGDAPPA